MAGRLAPFIELGRGLQPRADGARERRAQRRDDGPRRGARRERRLDAVLDFAELRDFVDLKLKNYSSGMMVRLAFAVMVEADADIMLIDEVLAVGDAAFAQKCMDVFREKRARGPDARARHPRHGDRAGASATARCCSTTASCATSATPRRRRCATTGSNFARRADGRTAAACPTSTCASSTPGCENERGRARSRTSSRASRSGSSVVFEARHDLDAPVFGFHFVDATARRCSASTGRCVGRRAGPDRRPAARVRIAGTIENPLLPGPLLRQLLDLAQPRPQGDLALHVVRLLDFVVYGTRPGPGQRVGPRRRRGRARRTA